MKKRAERPEASATTVGQLVFKSSSSAIVVVDAREIRCTLRGSLRGSVRAVGDALVVGDQVRLTIQADGTGAIEERLPRRNWLSRRREVGGGRELIVASNIDRVVAMFAARQPQLKFGALDRLLVAATRQELPAVIVINKMDLGLDAETADQLALYPPMGYPVLPLSLTDDSSLEPLRNLFAGSASVISGPSGVGKSSLLGKVLGIEIRVATVSDYNEKGRHTTSAATWYPLPNGGAVVDTPGFRDYGLWDLERRELAAHMPDLAGFVSQCRFGSCLHQTEPHCAVRAAVEAGAIDARRYRSYLGILESL
ncbi:MAG: ribosome small subunit-dependent GTPase A [Planctomycetota bacterium]